MIIKPSLGIYLDQDNAEWVTIDKQNSEVFFSRSKLQQLPQLITTKHNIHICLSDKLMPIKFYNLEGKLTKPTIKRYAHQVTKDQLVFYKVISQSSTVTRLLVISIDQEQLEEIIHLLQPLGKVKSVLPFCPTVTGRLPNSYADLNVDQNNNLIVKTLQPKIAALGLTENLNIHQAAAFAAAAKDYK